MVGGMFIQMQADLADMSRFSDENDGYKFILVAVDVFSRMGYAVPLKNKAGATVAHALDTLLSRLPYPIQSLQTDRGREFFNQEVNRIMTRHNVNLFASNSLYKANYAERLIRTFRKRIHRYLAHNNTKRWLPCLSNIVSGYNSTVHSSLGMAPNEVTLENQRKVWHHLYDKKILAHKEKFRYQVGDCVRIAMNRHAFTKEAYNTYSEEVFTIDKRYPGSPVCYGLRDLNNELLKGRFYEAELTKTVLPQVFVVDHVIKSKRQGRQKLHLVHWRGYPAAMDSWVNEKDMVSL